MYVRNPLNSSALNFPHLFNLRVSWFFKAYNFFGCNCFLYFLNFLCCTDCGTLGTIYISCFISVFFWDFLCTYNRVLKNLEKYIGAMTTDQHFVGNGDRFIADISTSFSIDYFICPYLFYYFVLFVSFLYLCCVESWEQLNYLFSADDDNAFLPKKWDYKERCSGFMRQFDWLNFQICKSKVSLGPKRLLSL